MSSTFDLGYLGGGQLARMSIQAAQRMGLRCLSLDPGDDTPASQIAPAVQGSLGDPAKIAEVLNRCERVTLENEFIPADAIREALRQTGRSEEAIVPGVDTLATIQDKLRQREALLDAGVPSPRAVPMDDGGLRAVEEIGFPMVLKARFGGYDGKGTRYARTQEELDLHRPLWEAGGWLAEEFVPFRRELAVMVALSGDRQVALHTVETIQTHHVCDFTFPTELSPLGTADATETAIAAVKAVYGHGLFGVELFETEDGRLLINEMAPRPHNTGHYTLDWGAASQFEYHVRVVMGLPMDDTPLGSFVYMANLLGQAGAGDYRKGLRAALALDEKASVHWYGKAESKPGRKMGHLNLVADHHKPADQTLPWLAKVRQAFYDAWTHG